MTHPCSKAQATLDAAIDAIRSRGYWTPFVEMPSPRVYGETANEAGKAAVEACFGKEFELDQPGRSGTAGTEVSPHGVDLNVRYPVRCRGVDHRGRGGDARMAEGRRGGSQRRLPEISIASTSAASRSPTR